MAESPAFQFYAAEYLADENVSLMTLEEEGAYWRAIAFCWREGSIPADEVKLSRLLKGASNQILTVVRNCFNQMPTDPTRLVHPRLEIERGKQKAWREKSAIAGRASGKARRNKGLHTEPPFDFGLNQMATKLEPNGNSSSSSSSSSSTQNTKAKTTAPQASLGRRIPENFAVTEEHRRFARDKGYISPDEIVDEFRDYWIGVPGSRGRKLDWDATFRNRMRDKTKPTGGSNGHYETNGKARTSGNQNALEEVLRRQRNRDVTDETFLRETGPDRPKQPGLLLG